MKTSAILSAEHNTGGEIMNKQPELHTTNLLMQPLSISYENAALQILRFSTIHENTHAWAIPLHTHPTI